MRFPQTQPHVIESDTIVKFFFVFFLGSDFIGLFGLFPQETEKAASARKDFTDSLILDEDLK